MKQDKYVFIDRDGVINKDPEGWTDYSYVTRPLDFYFLPSVLDALKKLHHNGYKTVVISNQQGVGLGYFTEQDLKKVTQKMLETVELSGGEITDVYYCTHRKEDDCNCRKPKQGLFLKAQEELGIKELKGKFYIGDTERDMQAGSKAGLKTILVLSGKSLREDVEKWEYKPDYICEDLLEAVEVVCGKR